MKYIRIIVFILLFYFIVPFDLYIHSDQRLHYFGTVIHNERVWYGGNENHTSFTFNLQNCKVYLFPDEEMNTNSFALEFGFEFSTPYSFNDTLLEIKATAT